MALIVDVRNLLQFQKVHKDKVRRRKKFCLLSNVLFLEEVNDLTWY